MINNIIGKSNGVPVHSLRFLILQKSEHYHIRILESMQTTISTLTPLHNHSVRLAPHLSSAYIRLRRGRATCAPGRAPVAAPRGAAAVCLSHSLPGCVRRERAGARAPDWAE